MTLMVTTYCRDPISGDFTDDPLPEKPGHALAGFESWRTTVWGSEAAKRRGARFLPQLADGDLYVEPEDLSAFADECTRLLEEVGGFATEVKADADHLRWDLQNLLRAVESAAPEVGGVHIG